MIRDEHFLDAHTLNILKRMVAALMADRMMAQEENRTAMVRSQRNGEAKSAE